MHLNLSIFCITLSILLQILHILAASNSKTTQNLNKNLQDESSVDLDDDYNDDTEDEKDGVKQSSPSINSIRLQRIGTTYWWGKWEKWSKCANSCVQIRRRKCHKRILNATDIEGIETQFYPDPEQTGCFGILKRYRLCKDERCKSNNRRLRDEQCEKFNKILYKGKFHNWLSYEKEHNECELYCRPSDSEIFISMNQSVTDGTTCNRPSVYYTHYYRRNAVCVEGICRAVHASGAIRPATTYDSRMKCGSVLCQQVDKYFGKAKLPPGYNYVDTIPAGAMNLSIKQLPHSVNLLALKSTEDVFILNGNHTDSETGTYMLDDDSEVFEYNREMRLITSKGPLDKPIVLVLLVRGINVGVRYNYTLPMPSASISEQEYSLTHWDEWGRPLSDAEISTAIDAAGAVQLAKIKERKRSKFFWKVLGFGQCSRSCGPGVRVPIYSCRRDKSSRSYSPKRCASAEKQTFIDSIYLCNLGLCPAYWILGDYSECKCKAGVSKGVRTKFSKCVQEQINRNIEEVSETLCAGSKPVEMGETCICTHPVRTATVTTNTEKDSRENS